ncbi:MAG TPA: MATE family efflux transporter [Steroidobacteraceae bacterium]|jgi:putative MATE family efflux protein|nr:MATE family efflux transporter [Steroidobacteraceae bacterium]
MKDLTQGSIVGHLIRMASVMLVGMMGQTLYYLVDLYFVARIGPEAIAGVGAAGNITFVVLALTQILNVGTIALVSHAAGRKDQRDANLVFNQSLALSALVGVFVLVAGYLLTPLYLHMLSADGEMQRAGITYLYWFLPGLALQFAMVSMSAALRGTGIVQPTMTVQVLTVLLNALLAPVLIAGWITGRPLGVAGAGLASTISIAAGVLMLTLYFTKLEKYVGFHSEQWHPRPAYWKRILNIGLPAGGEFFVMFLMMGLMYWLIRPFGAEAQAGYGVGQRIMQAIFLPAMAVAFSVAPVAGQNFGARRTERVREAFRKAVLLETAIMVVITLLAQMAPSVFIRPFTTDAKVIEVGTLFLRIISWNFVGTGIIFTCSGMFQAMGNTWPALLSGASRLVIFGAPALWLSMQPSFHLELVWEMSVVTVIIQAVLSYTLLQLEMRKKLASAAPAAVAT